MTTSRKRGGGMLTGIIVGGALVIAFVAGRGGIHLGDFSVKPFTDPAPIVQPVTQPAGNFTLPTAAVVAPAPQAPASGVAVQPRGMPAIATTVPVQPTAISPEVQAQGA